MTGWICSINAWSTVYFSFGFFFFLNKKKTATAVGMGVKMLQNISITASQQQQRQKQTSPDVHLLPLLHMTMQTNSRYITCAENQRTESQQVKFRQNFGNNCFPYYN